jgi:excisionase family DNA binding protein
MRLVSIKTVAEYLMVKQSTLYSWVHKGSIPFHKLNGLVRFDMDEIESWVKKAKHIQSSPSLTVKRIANQAIDKIVRKAIDDVHDNRYNPSKRETRPNQGLRKE